MKSTGKNVLSEITLAGPVLTRAITPPPRMMAGSVRTFGDQLQQEVTEAKEIREQIANGELIVELDPDTLDISFARDRIDNDDDEAFRNLVESIRNSGQQIPVLVRPVEPNGRYQIAFGHRRVRAARTLGIKVKAIVRRLSDEQLVIAQGQENNARKDLTFIEKALFAWRLANSGVAREVISIAMVLSKSHLSDHLTIVQTVTPEIILKVGAAPTIGRTRWQALADRLKDPGHLESAKQIVSSPDFPGVRDKFGYLIEHVSTKASEARLVDLKTSSGVLLGQFTLRASGSRIVMRNRRFSAYLESRLPELISQFEADQLG
jgi:ParB family transcriptional regulator, chromosome partitioning protein